MRQRSSSTHLIILHLSTFNQLRLVLNLYELDDGPFFRSEPLDLNFQICEEVALGSDQWGKQVFIVVEPSVLSGCGLHLL